MDWIFLLWRLTELLFYLESHICSTRGCQLGHEMKENGMNPAYSCPGSCLVSLDTWLVNLNSYL